jgi:hypothetical protein
MGAARLAGSQTACMRTLLQWQVLNLLHRVKDEQTCNNNNNSNNKARCIPAELCKQNKTKQKISRPFLLTLEALVSVLQESRTLWTCGDSAQSP